MRLESESEARPSPPSLIRILAKRLYDPYTRSILSDKEILVDTLSGLILAVSDTSSVRVGYTSRQEDSWYSNELASARTIDLRDAQLVLPGFVDTHVHFFLHPYDETSWDDQVTKESLTERTIRAVTHAKATLLAGYTTVRDLGTEGAEDADVSLRKCISSPAEMIPGPRYFISSRATVSTGSYGPKHDLFPTTEGVEGIVGAIAVDGVDACRAAVRKQVGAGADWIKLYADYRTRSRMVQVAPSAGNASTVLWTREEAFAIIDEAHRVGVKVAAHLSGFEALELLRDCAFKGAVIDSIEHGHEMLFDPRASGASLDPLARLLGSASPSSSTSSPAPKFREDLLDFLAEYEIFWSPTLATYEWKGGESWKAASRTFRQVLCYNAKRSVQQRKGVRIACGGDTGVFAHGTNAKEMVCMVKLGVDPLHVLAWDTLGGWRCIRASELDHAVRSTVATLVPGRETGMGDIEEAETAIGARFLDAVKRSGRKLSRAALGDNAVPFGAILPGFAADIIALGGSPGELESNAKGLENAVEASNVIFVMKGGRVWKGPEGI